MAILPYGHSALWPFCLMAILPIDPFCHMAILPIGFLG